MADFEPNFDLEVKSQNDNLEVEVTNARLRPGSVNTSSGGGLFVDVEGFEWELDGTKGVYSGAVAQSVTASATNYIYLDSSGVLQINTSGFPANSVTHIKLAEVITNTSEVQSILDRRQFLTSNASSVSPIPDTLDEAYDGSGSGAGRVITADSGPVEISGYSTEAPFRIAPAGTAPSSNLANGQEFTFSLGGGMPCKAIYDSTRSKWLSTQMTPISFGRSGSVDQALLAVGTCVALGSGVKIPYNATIVAITSQSSGGNSTKQMAVLVNGSLTPAVTWNESGNTALLNNVNVDLNAGDFIRAGADAPGAAVDDPVVTVWICWRF